MTVSDPPPKYHIRTSPSIFEVVVDLSALGALGYHSIRQTVLGCFTFDIHVNCITHVSSKVIVDDESSHFRHTLAIITSTSNEANTIGVECVANALPKTDHPATNWQSGTKKIHVGNWPTTR